jgi:hypothetical protein
VAGGITNGKENRLVLLPRLRERLLTPGIPVDGIMGMLEKIRAGLPGEPIGVAGLLRNDDTAG